MRLYPHVRTRLSLFVVSFLVITALFADGVAGARAQSFTPPSTCDQVFAATSRGGATLPASSDKGGLSCSKSEKPEADGASVLVKRVIDGDTIVLENDERVRYISIDTPEYTTKKEPFGKEATDLNRKLVEGKRVYLVKGVTDRDGFGRLLRYVFVEGVMVEAELAREGLAEFVVYQKGQPYAACLEQLANEAKAAKRGMWAV